MLGRSGAATLNGGFDADYVYSGFSLSNSTDQVRILSGEDELSRLDYGAGFAEAGVSRELGRADGGAADYLLATTPYGLGDLGTPGLAGQFDSVSAVPLPASAWLLIGAMGVLTRLRRRQPNRMSLISN